MFKEYFEYCKIIEDNMLFGCIVFVVEVIDIVCYLVFDVVGFVIGQVIMVDGGCILIDLV